jgi:two-component system NtrC family sensor kinase
MGGEMYKPAVGNNRMRRTDKATVLQEPCLNLKKAKATINHFSPATKQEPELLQQLQLTINHIKEKSISQSKLASIGQLSSYIVHELNQPLFYFRIICEATLKDIKNEELDTVELHNDMHETLLQLERARKIIDQLLHFSRSNDNTFNSTAVQNALDGALVLMRPKLKSCGVEFLEEREPDLPSISGQEVRIQQMFINLIQNSIDAMEGQDGKEIRLTLCQKEQMLQLQFSDNGPGIPPKHQGRIFEPFFTTKPAGQGTGLGLAIVADIVKAHHGTIGLNSKRKKGTEFLIKIPALKASVQTGCIPQN